MFVELRQRQNIILVTVSIIFLLLVYAVAPPVNFPAGSIVTIEEGKGVSALGQDLKDYRLINSTFWFRVVAMVLGGERGMKAGQYYFAERESAIAVAWRILHADYRIKSVKLTIPEGFTVEKISNLFDERFAFFDKALFVSIAPEGYLFPDTYFVPVTATASSTIKLMQDNFEKQISTVMSEVEISGKTLEQVMIMASFLEAEVKTQEDREIAAGILWKRLKIGMALQVDSYMWTYKFAGLPEKPINNPGLVSIRAALNPKTTAYLYFLTGKDGKTHYAKTFDEHQTNIQKYLAD